MSPHPKKKPKTQWWTCARCGTRNDPDHHPRSCRGCGTERPQASVATRRICRTAEDAFMAGWQDGADDPPLTEEQRTRIAALLAPHIRPAAAAA